MKAISDQVVDAVVHHGMKGISSQVVSACLYDRSKKMYNIPKVHDFSVGPIRLFFSFYYRAP